MKTLQEIQQLIEFLSKSGFSHFEMEEEDGFKLRLTRAGALESVAPALPVAAAPAEAAPPAGNGPSPAPATSAPAPQPSPAPAEDLHEIKSPIVGTFYRSPNPEADTFVEIGSRIASGQTLCIVEAMKLMNEIESDIDGEVVEIVVRNGQPVEYGETLFRIRPAGA